MNKIILGSLFAVISLGGLGFFIFIIRSLKSAGGFGNLTVPSKIIAVLMTIVSLVAVFAGGWFSYTNFSYKPPQQTESTKQLEDQIKKSTTDDKEYAQLISTDDYYNATIKELLGAYSKEGISSIDNYSQGSEKSKAFILRNVGRTYKTQEGLFTTQLKTVSGEIIHLDKDKKGRVLIFADDTEYSANILKTFRKYNLDHEGSKIEYTIIFPTLDGSKVAAFFTTYGSEIGGIDENSVVTIDSQPNSVNQSIYGIATQEYSVTDLPSYLAIDSNGVISLAGVGSLVDSDEKLNSWLESAFNSKNKLYNEIKKGVDRDKTKDDTKTGQESNSNTNTGSTETTVAPSSTETTSGGN